MGVVLGIEEIKKRCEIYGMKCKCFDDKVIVTTDKAEWYFNPNSQSNIKLYHSNYIPRNSIRKFSGAYHQQKKKFSSQAEILRYIYQHDKEKYKPRKKGRIEIIFDRIEKK